MLSGNDAGDATEQEFLLGNVAPLTAVVLATQGARGGFTIDDFVDAPDIANDGTLGFRAGTTSSPGSSAVFRGETAVAVRGQALQPSAGFTGGTYRIPNRVQISADGTGTSFTSSVDGLGSANALFTDDGANAPLKFFFSPTTQNQSTVVSGTRIAANIGNSSYEVSSDGTRFTAEIITPGSPFNLAAVAVGEVGGAVTVPTINGSPIRRETHRLPMVPPSSGTTSTGSASPTTGRTSSPGASRIRPATRPTSSSPSTATSCSAPATPWRRCLRRQLLHRRNQQHRRLRGDHDDRRQAVDPVQR